MPSRGAALVSGLWAGRDHGRAEARPSRTDGAPPSWSWAARSGRA